MCVYITAINGSLPPIRKAEDTINHHGTMVRQEAIRTKPGGISQEVTISEILTANPEMSRGKNLKTTHTDWLKCFCIYRF